MIPEREFCPVCHPGELVTQLLKKRAFREYSELLLILAGWDMCSNQLVITWAIRDDIIYQGLTELWETTQRLVSRYLIDQRIIYSRASERLTNSVRSTLKLLNPRGIIAVGCAGRRWSFSSEGSDQTTIYVRSPFFVDTLWPNCPERVRLQTVRGILKIIQTQGRGEEFFVYDVQLADGRKLRLVSWDADYSFGRGEHLVGDW